MALVTCQIGSINDIVSGLYLFQQAPNMLRLFAHGFAAVGERCLVSYARNKQVYRGNNF